MRDPLLGGEHVLMWNAEPRSESAQALVELRRLPGGQVHDLAAAVRRVQADLSLWLCMGVRRVAG